MGRDQSFTKHLLERFTKMAQRGGGRWFEDEGWPEMLNSANRLEEQLGARPPQRVLDLACGTGAPTVALALKGYRVTGMDITPAMIDIARRGAAGKGACVEWICQDMRTLSYHEEFDHVMIRDVIFGLFEDERENVELIAQIARALKPMGKCLFEAYNKEFARTHGVEGSHFYDAVADRFVAEDPNERLRSIKLYSLDEWDQMLSANGLTITLATGWKHARDPEPPPWRADILVAQKVRERRAGRF